MVTSRSQKIIKSLLIFHINPNEVFIYYIDILFYLGCRILIQNQGSDQEFDLKLRITQL